MQQNQHSSPVPCRRPAFPCSKGLPAMIAILPAPTLARRMTALLAARCFGTPVWFWLAFLVLVAALTLFDLGLFNRRDKAMGVAGRAASLGAMVFEWLVTGWKGRGPQDEIFHRLLHRRRCRSTISSSSA